MNATGINTYIKVDSYPDILEDKELYLSNDSLPEIDLVLESN
jgi:hypothetical protein